MNLHATQGQNELENWQWKTGNTRYGVMLRDRKIHGNREQLTAIPFWTTFTTVQKVWNESPRRENATAPKMWWLRHSSNSLAYLVAIAVCFLARRENCFLHLCPYHRMILLLPFPEVNTFFVSFTKNSKQQILCRNRMMVVQDNSPQLSSPSASCPQCTLLLSYLKS